MLFVVIKPRYTSNPNFVRNSCCGGKPVILISSRSILHSFFSKELGQAGGQTPCLPVLYYQSVLHVQELTCGKAPFRKEMPVSLWHRKSLFQGKARTNWWSNQLMLAICHFCSPALSHILYYSVSAQLQHRACPGISCGRQFVHSFIHAV